MPNICPILLWERFGIGLRTGKQGQNGSPWLWKCDSWQCDGRAGVLCNQELEKLWLADRGEKLHRHCHIYIWYEYPLTDPQENRLD